MTLKAQIEKMKISIHALREEGDQTVAVLDKMLHISIHALREEGDRAGCRTPAP